MTALAIWLKQLVMIVLLAIVSDLLLPTKSLQKYVRTVLSLAIIAAMLQPVVPFMRKDWADDIANLAIAEFDKGQAQASSYAGAAEAYSHELGQQEATDAARIAGSALMEQLPKRYQAVVRAIDVSGTSPSNIRVQVQFQPNGVSSETAAGITRWLAAKLNISVQQIHTATAGG